MQIVNKYLSKINVLFFLYFYRILNWQEKVSSFRLVGYLFFGYLISANFNLLIIFLNTLVLGAILAFGFALNDYYDFKLRNEKNFIGLVLQEDKLSEKWVKLFIFLPLLLTIFLIYIPLKMPLLWAMSGLILMISYSVPPLRLKEKKLLGFLIPPLATTILFFQAYSLKGDFILDVFLLAAILFLFQAYLESLHILGDLPRKERAPISGKVAFKLLRVLPFSSLILSLGFMVVNSIFIITALFSLVRLWSLRKITPETNFLSLRKNIFYPQLSLYEFLFYSGAGIIHLI